MKILGILGSLRKESFNKILLETLKEKVSKSDFEIYSPNLPLLNEDLVENLPSELKDFAQKIKSADAIVIATPEYNHSTTSIVKNAVDWATILGGNVIKGKKVFLIGVSSGQVATARAQMHLREILTASGAKVEYEPQILVGPGKDKIEKGEVTDEHTLEKLEELAGLLEK